MLLAVAVCLVYFDRDSYTDNWDGQVSFIDSVYYSTVTITTTGYGDTPRSRRMRGFSTRSS